MKWNDVDWTQRRGEIAAQMGVSRQHVYNVWNRLLDGFPLPKKREPRPDSAPSISLTDLILHECAVCGKRASGELPPVGWVEFGDKTFCGEAHYRAAALAAAASSAGAGK